MPKVALILVLFLTFSLCIVDGGGVAVAIGGDVAAAAAAAGAAGLAVGVVGTHVVIRFLLNLAVNIRSFLDMVKGCGTFLSLPFRGVLGYVQNLFNILLKVLNVCPTSLINDVGSGLGLGASLAAAFGLGPKVNPELSLSGGIGGHLQIGRPSLLPGEWPRPVSISRPRIFQVSARRVRSISQPGVQTVSQSGVLTISHHGAPLGSQPGGFPGSPLGVQTISQSRVQTVSHHGAAPGSQPGGFPVSPPGAHSISHSSVLTVSHHGAPPGSQPGGFPGSPPGVQTISQSRVLTASHHGVLPEELARYRQVFGGVDFAAGTCPSLVVDRGVGQPSEQCIRYASQYFPSIIRAIIKAAVAIVLPPWPGASECEKESRAMLLPVLTQAKACVEVAL
ncbi:maker681 [Drosophila busckii]|uniref:Maker681 n=1 Tax=Drosophila busckii TaxID=30019 RepID=A0A0M4EKE1_DROBS|nr:uncharacterized protein LOC108598803 [Drosophila busckii]ALC43697.1 maker681 [Drosophila busckii]